MSFKVSDMLSDWASREFDATPKTIHGLAEVIKEYKRADYEARTNKSGYAAQQTARGLKD